MPDMEQHPAGWQCCNCKCVNMYDWLPPGSYKIYWRRPRRGESNQEPFCRGANCPSTQGGTVANPVAHRRCGKCVYLDSGSASLDHCDGQEYTGDDSESSHEGDRPGPEAQREGQQAGDEDSGTRQDSQHGSSGGQRHQVSGTTGRSYQIYSSTASKSTDKNLGSKVKIARRGTSSGFSRGRSTGAASSTNTGRHPVTRSSRVHNRRELPSNYATDSRRSSVSSTSAQNYQAGEGARKSQHQESLTSSMTASRTGHSPRSTLAPHRARSIGQQRADETRKS